MTASALIAQKFQYVTTNKVTVYNPGGFVQCHVEEQNGQYNLSLVGNATELSTFKMEIDDGNIRFIDCVLTQEQVQYEKCSNFVKQKLGNLV